MCENVAYLQTSYLSSRYTTTSLTLRGGRSGKRLVQANNILQTSRRDTTKNSEIVCTLIIYQGTFQQIPTAPNVHVYLAVVSIEAIDNSVPRDDT